MIPEWLATFSRPTSLVLTMLVVALFLAFIRLVRGPTLPDRVIALDLMSTLVVGIMAANAVATRQPVLLDVAVLLTLISFLAAVAFGLYVGKGARR